MRVVFGLVFGSLLIAGACTRDLDGAPCPCLDEVHYHCCNSINVCYRVGQACPDDASGGKVNTSGGAATQGGKPASSGGANNVQGGTSNTQGGATAQGGASNAQGGLNGAGNTAASGGTTTLTSGGTSSHTGGGGAGGDGGGGTAGAAGEGGFRDEPDFEPVVTQHNDNGRTGANLNERVLNATNVKTSFGELSHRLLRGGVFAQPLVAPKVTLQDGRTLDVVYVVTMANVVYALDALHPESPPLWSRTLGTSIPLPDAEISLGSQQMWHEVGILGTPVISLSENALYLVAASKEDGVYAHRLHKLALGSGIGTSTLVAQTGFESARQMQRSALTLANGVVYVPFGTYDPNSSLGGWLFAYDTNLSLLSASALGNPYGAGVDMSGQGPAFANDGTLYFTTLPGAAPWAATSPELGARLVQLQNPSAPQLSDRFFPVAASSGSNELGGSGPLLIPNSNRILLAGQHRMYLLGREQSGATMLQTFRASTTVNCVDTKTPCDAQQTSPVFWPGAFDTPVARAFVWPPSDVLSSFAFLPESGTFACTDPDTACKPYAASIPSDADDAQSHPIERGANLSVSSNGSQSGSGIVWATHAFSTDSLRNPDGVLRAFDADSLDLLWSTEREPKTLGLLAPNATATVSGGRIFVGTADGVTDKKTFWDDWTRGAPALATLNNQYLVIAWGRVTSSVNGFQLAWTEDGINYSNTSSVTDNFATYEPALASGGGKLYLGWMAPSQSIKVAISNHPAFIRPQFMTQQSPGGSPTTLSYQATASPALAYGNGRLFMAWNEGDQIHIVSSSDGASFDTSTLFTLSGYFSYQAPTLTYLEGKLYLITTNNMHQMNLFVSSDDGVHFAGPVPLPMPSAGHPALFTMNPQGSAAPDFHIAWADVPELDKTQGRIKLASSYDGNVPNFARTHQLESEEGDFSLNCAQFKGAWYISWMGIGDTNHPNVARYSPGELATYGLLPH